MIVLTDRNFGRLTVIDMAGLDRTGHKLWSCLCDCGRQINASAHNLTSGKTRSCGCLRSDTIAAAGRRRQVPVVIGARYAMLTVLAEAGRGAQNRVMVRARCDCGRETIASWINVRNGTTKSCGCQKSRGWRESLRVRMSRRPVPSNDRTVGPDAGLSRQVPHE